MEDVYFPSMMEPEMREWVGRHPEKVNDFFDGYGNLLLHSAARNASPSFVAELVDKYGADVNKHQYFDGKGSTPLFSAGSVATVSVLLKRGADPTARDSQNMTPLIIYSLLGWVDYVERLLQEPGAIVTINAQGKGLGWSALHCVYHNTDDVRVQLTKLLLLAGADPHIQDWRGRPPLQQLQLRHPNDSTCNSFLQEAMSGDGERTFLLHKARHLSDAAHTLTTTVAKVLAKTAPPTLSSRMPLLPLSMVPHLPRVELAPLQQQHAPSAAFFAEEEEKKKRRAVLLYVLRLEKEEEGEGAGSGTTGGGGGSDGMPSEVFYELLKLMGPSYYPVKEGAGSDGKV